MRREAPVRFGEEKRSALLTPLPTWAGFLYLAVVLDAFSRRIVGWAMGYDLRTQLVLDALNMTIGQRRPKDVIHHSDRGSQYLSIEYTERLTEAGIEPSVGSVGDSYDNALAETISVLFKAEVIHRRGPWLSFDAVE